MTALLNLLLRYLPQILGAVLIISIYFWHRAEIVSETEDRVNAAWIKRDAKTRWESQAKLDEKNREIELVKQEQSSRYIGAIESYAEHTINLNNTLNAERDKRLFISARTSCDNNTMQGKAASSEANSRRRETVYRAELEPETARTIRENAGEVERGKLACAELLKLVENEITIK